VVQRFSARLRSDPALPYAHGRSEPELEDHLPTFLTDLAQALVALDENGGDTSAILRDGSDVQRLLAERHGAQRYRMGWTVEGIVREYQIVREEIEAAAGRSGAAVPPDARDSALEILRVLLARAEEVTLGGFHAAVQGETSRAGDGR
jgi:hypothetical protein